MHYNNTFLEILPNRFFEFSFLNFWYKVNPKLQLALTDELRGEVISVKK